MNIVVLFVIGWIVFIVTVFILALRDKTPEDAVQDNAMPDVVEVNFVVDGQIITKSISTATYNSLMELADDPRNGQLVNKLLEGL